MWEIKDGKWVNTETGQEFEYKGNKPKGGDGFKSGNAFANGTKKDLNKVIEFFLKNGRAPERYEIELDMHNEDYSNGNAWNDYMADLESFKKKNNLENINAEKGKEADVSDFLKSTANQTEYNPYLEYMNLKEQELRGAELGLANTQTQANIQNAEITAQQGMMQQSQLRDQLLEQIKSDRMNKMRSGLTPMQIANEELQFMVGNMQNNNQQMGLVNQQRLAGHQQMSMNPYQAQINAAQAVTGGQGYANLTSGLAATDAGDLYMQALRLRQLNPRKTIDDIYKQVANPQLT